MPRTTTHPTFADARSDHDQLFWTQAFIAFIRDGEAASAVDLGFTPQEVERLTGLAATFDAMYLAASNRAIRTGDDVARKDAARDQAMAEFRKHANRIKADPRIPPEIKICLGIKPPEATQRGRVPAPTTAPLISIIGGLPGEGHLIRLADSLTPDSRRKPHGVQHMQLFMALTRVGGPEIVDPADPAVRFIRNQREMKFTMPFTREQLGMIATYFGRWETRTCLLGPWSLPASMAVVV